MNRHEKSFIDNGNVLEMHYGDFIQLYKFTKQHLIVSKIKYYLKAKAKANSTY